MDPHDGDPPTRVIQHNSAYISNCVHVPIHLCCECCVCAFSTNGIMICDERVDVPRIECVAYDFMEVADATDSVMLTLC